MMHVRAGGLIDLIVTMHTDCDAILRFLQESYSASNATQKGKLIKVVDARARQKMMILIYAMSLKEYRD